MPKVFLTFRQENGNISPLSQSSVIVSFFTKDKSTKRKREKKKKSSSEENFSLSTEKLLKAKQAENLPNFLLQETHFVWRRRIETKTLPLQGQ